MRRRKPRGTAGSILFRKRRDATDGVIEIEIVIKTEGDGDLPYQTSEKCHDYGKLFRWKSWDGSKAR